MPFPNSLNIRYEKDDSMSTRRQFLHTGASLAAGLFATSATQATGPSSSEDKEIIGHGEFRYRVHKDWADVNPSDIPITNCHEMVQDSQGRLVMIGDNPHNNVIVFDRSGKVLKAWGTMWPGGHGLTLNNEGGEDVLYIAECGYSHNMDGSGYRQNGFVSKTKMDGSVIFEGTLGTVENGKSFEVPLTEEPPQLRAGASGNVYFSMNGELYGPAGAPGTVAKGVVLSKDAVAKTYAVADLEAEQNIALKQLVAELQTQSVETPAE